MFSTHMPDGEKDERRREQQGQHVAEGRECERHSSAVASVESRLGRLTMCWGSLVTVSRIVGSGAAASFAPANHEVGNFGVSMTALCWGSFAIAPSLHICFSTCFFPINVYIKHLFYVESLDWIGHRCPLSPFFEMIYRQILKPWQPFISFV